jgi:hypothetical protein
MFESCRDRQFQVVSECPACADRFLLHGEVMACHAVPLLPLRIEIETALPTSAAIAKRLTSD